MHVWRVSTLMCCALLAVSSAASEIARSVRAEAEMRRRCSMRRGCDCSRKKWLLL
jgi:hypothetical protein